MISHNFFINLTNNIRAFIKCHSLNEQENLFKITKNNQNVLLNAGQWEMILFYQKKIEILQDSLAFPEKNELSVIDTSVGNVTFKVDVIDSLCKFCIIQNSSKINLSSSEYSSLCMMKQILQIYKTRRNLENAVSLSLILD